MIKLDERQACQYVYISLRGNAGFISLDQGKFLLRHAVRRFFFRTQVLHTSDSLVAEQ